jgi:hypothetical protein
MSEGEREQELETQGRQIRETEARPRNFYLRAVPGQTCPAWAGEDIPRQG